MSSSPTKAYVFPVAGREREIDTLKTLILVTCNVVCHDNPADDFEDCVDQADVVVILICPETMAGGTVDEVIALAKRLGKRVVGVWASDQEPDRLPSLLHRHGDAAISLDVEKVAIAVCGGKPIWDSPGGGPRPKPPTPRHKGH